MVNDQGWWFIYSSKKASYEKDFSLSELHELGVEDLRQQCCLYLLGTTLGTIDLVWSEIVHLLSQSFKGIWRLISRRFIHSSTDSFWPCLSLSRLSSLVELRPRTWGRLAQPKRCTSPVRREPSKPRRWMDGIWGDRKETQNLWEIHFRFLSTWMYALCFFHWICRPWLEFF